MKHFTHAIWLSLKYKWTIAGSVICSLAIAFLFCFSISTVFPVIKIVLEGETAQQWVANEIEATQAEQDDIAEEIAELTGQLANLPKDERRPIESRIALKENRLDAEKKAQRWYEKYQPYINRYAPKKPFNTLVVAMLFLLVATVTKGVLLVASTILVGRVANRTVWDMQRIYYRKALELDQQRIDMMGTSVMMTHLSNNMSMVSGGLRVLYGKSLREPFKMITCLIGAAMISTGLLLISLIVIPAGGYVVHTISRRMKQSVQRELGGISEAFQTLIETLSWLKTVRIFNREGTERRRFKENAGVMYKMSMRISMYDSLLRPTTEVLGIVSIALSILAGSYLVLNQTTHLFGIQILDRPIKPGMLVLFYGLLAGASDPARKMSEIVNVIVRGDTACENLMKSYDAPSTITTPENPVPVPQHCQAIEFRNVSFRYNPKQPVLNDVSLTIPFGQTVAIVGGNGCGKSTLMNLLPRFYDPQAGNVLLDGVNLRDVNPKRLRRQIAWVTQQSVLFKGSVKDNIAYGARGATDGQIARATEIARVVDFLPRLKDGIDTQVGDNGSQLSAGQRQRVALARAVLANPRILILDEATSQMDGNTESMIHDSLEEFIVGRTTFVVTHRSSSLKLADRVIVMERGQIVHDDTVIGARTSSSEFQQLFAKSA